MRRAVVLVLVLAFVAVVPAPGGGRSAASDGPVVGVIGDSLLAYDRADLDASLRAVGWTGSRIDAVPSRRIPDSVRAPLSGIKAIRALRAEGFDTPYWVIALGTNDIGLLGSSDPRALVTGLLDELGPGTKVLWVNADQPRYPEATARFDGALASVLDERGGFVFDWAALARANRSWLVSDGIHLTGAGYRQRHRLLAQASRALLDGAMPPSAYQPVAGPTVAPSSVVPGVVRVAAPNGLLRIGMDGRKVAGLQTFLRRQGWYPKKATGSYGFVTRLAVKRMQVVLAAAGFPSARIDGIYDTTTARALSDYLTSLLPAPPSTTTTTVAPTTTDSPAERTTTTDPAAEPSTTSPSP